MAVTILTIKTSQSLSKEQEADIREKLSGYAVFINAGLTHNEIEFLKDQHEFNETQVLEWSKNPWGYELLISKKYIPYYHGSNDNQKT